MPETAPLVWEIDHTPTPLPPTGAGEPKRTHGSAPRGTLKTTAKVRGDLLRWAVSDHKATDVENMTSAGPEIPRVCGDSMLTNDTVVVAERTVHHLPFQGRKWTPRAASPSLSPASTPQ